MKKTTYQRIFALAFALVMVLSLLPASGLLFVAQADEEKWADDPVDTWVRIANKDDASLNVDAEDSFHATFVKYYIGYYNHKIDVVDGTKISFQIQFSGMVDASLVQYGFALVDKPHCFYNNNADTTATNIMLEMVGMPAETTMKMGTSKYLGSRIILQHGAPYDDVRSKDTVYTVTYEKINVTEDGVNYSWLLTVTGATNEFTARFKADDIAHDVFANGAYIAAGSMAGSTVHTMEISNLSISQPTTEEPPVDDPVDPPVDPVDPPVDNPDDPPKTGDIFTAVIALLAVSGMGILTLKKRR